MEFLAASELGAGGTQASGPLLVRGSLKTAKEASGYSPSTRPEKRNGTREIFVPVPAEVSTFHSHGFSRKSRQNPLVPRKLVAQDLLDGDSKSYWPMITGT